MSIYLDYYMHGCDRCFLSVLSVHVFVCGPHIGDLLRCYGLGLPILKNFHHLQLISTSCMFGHIYFHFSEHAGFCRT